jgi:hypothetical protein
MQKPTTWGKVKGTITNEWGSVKNFFGLRGMEGLKMFSKLKKAQTPKFKSAKIAKFQNSSPFNSGKRIKGSPMQKFRRFRSNNPVIQDVQAIQPVPETQYEAEIYNDAEVQHDTDIQGVGAVLTICIIAGIAVIAGAGTTALVLCKQTGDLDDYAALLQE